MAGRGAALEALGTGPPPPPPPRPHPVFQTAAHAGGGARGTRGRAGAGAPRGGARVSASGLDLREAVSQVCAWPALGGVEGGLRGTVLGGGKGAHPERGRSSLWRALRGRSVDFARVKVVLSGGWPG